MNSIDEDNPYNNKNRSKFKSRFGRYNSNNNIDNDNDTLDMKRPSTVSIMSDIDGNDVVVRVDNNKEIATPLTPTEKKKIKQTNLLMTYSFNDESSDSNNGDFSFI